MGAGNWFPGSSLDDCEVFYVEIPRDAGDDTDLDEWYYQDMICEVKQIAGDSFDFEPMQREIRDKFDSLGRQDYCLGYNGLHGIFVKSEDNGRYGIGFICRADSPAFARPHLRGLRDRMLAGMSRVYDCYVRTSAWTSVMYEVTAKEVQR